MGRFIGIRYSPPALYIVMLHLCSVHCTMCSTLHWNTKIQYIASPSLFECLLSPDFFNSMIEVNLNIFVVFIINIQTNMVLAEVLYQRRILNVRTSPGLMDAHARASYTTGGPLATPTPATRPSSWKQNIRHRKIDRPACCCLLDSKSNKVGIRWSAENPVLTKVLWQKPNTSYIFNFSWQRN